ncbi:hypothetical protein HK099_008709 [Clydaea vesicula]|uniref:Cilia- and flagella-associated protein 206 n=1 Tax=Clydaea vesicula TaxID=447962 RepID=A0AAD5XXP1_9FUNG|nr:hypothetical protein HK099_008709 [Clydaea vesicula]
MNSAKEQRDYSDDKIALEHVISDIVSKANNELKAIKLSSTLNSIVKLESSLTNHPPKDSNIPISITEDETKKIENQQTDDKQDSQQQHISTLHSTTQNLKSRVSPYAVTDTLAAFVLRSVALDPQNKFDVDMEFEPNEVNRLINTCVEKIVQTNSPQMETVKMQVYFDTHFPAQADFLQKEKMSRTQACSVVLKEITDIKTKSVSIYESLYRKVASYVLIKSHVGNPTDIRIIREGTAALESVFPQSELSTFIPLTRVEKEEQLNGLTQLVTGIRLFNKQLGKGGESIDNLPELCASELQDLTTTVGQLTTETETFIQVYSGAIDYLTKFPEEQFEEVSLPNIKSALAFRRQLLMYLDALQDQMIRSRSTLLTLSNKFDSSVQELKTICRAKTAVAVDQVYPHFLLLSSLWINWLDELFLLSFRRGLIDVLEFHSKSFEALIPEKLKVASSSFLKDVEPVNLSEQEIIAAASELMVAVTSINRGVDIIHPGNITNYFNIPVEYGGFCPVTLLFRDGLVVPGNKNIGLLRYKDSVFCFAGIREAKEFAKTPEKFIEGVVIKAKFNPDLVQLLHLYQYFPTVDALEKARSFTRQKLLGKLPMVSEVGTQVDTHIVDGYIDPKYKWNEWELRRSALLLVNLKNKRTHGAQTDLSHFKRDITQTSTESSTSVPRRVNFHRGLRNDGKNVKFKVVDLTLNL